MAMHQVNNKLLPRLLSDGWPSTVGAVIFSIAC